MSRQVGIDNATQKFITFLDSDDVFMPYTVETFNSTITSNQEIELLHSSFYEQIVIDSDNSPALYLWQDNYTACHGKLYNVELLKKYGIKNSPLVKYADDSYFNSMCSELMKMSVIKIPTMIWINNKDSIMRKNDPNRDAIIKEDFLNAMLLSAKFVLEKKGYVVHLHDTINRIPDRFSLNEKEKIKLNELLKFIENGGNK